MEGVLSFAGVSADPGQKTRGRSKAVELSDGSWAEFPVTVVNGAHDGPVVYLGAGIHGDEYNGIAVIRDIVNGLDPADMRGGVIAVPIQNPIAHRGRGRLTLIVQTDETNMHRVWPGDPDRGDSAQRMAGILFREMNDAGVEVSLDFHTGATGQLCAPHTFVPSEEGGAGDVAYELARSFGFGVIMRAHGGAYSNPLWMQHSLVAAGIAAFGVELGAGRVFQDEFIKLGVDGCRNMLRTLEVIPGEAIEHPEPRRLVDESWVRANRGGFARALRPWGEDVVAGDPVAEITDVFGEVLETLTAPVDGYLMNQRTEPAIATGERLCRIGVDA